MNSRISRALDWLDSRKSWQFVVILYTARWVVLAPIMLFEHFCFLGDQQSAAQMSELSKVNLAVLLVFMVIMSPLLETLLECTLPYFIVSRVRNYRQSRPKRPWGFVVVSACVMALLHPMLAALAPSFITGAFLAYCYSHFAQRRAWQAILAATVFHGAINIVGWVMMMVSTNA